MMIKPSIVQHGLAVSQSLLAFKILNLMPSRESFSIEKDFFPSLVENDMYAYKSNSEFIDIGTPKNLRMAKFILGKHNFSIKTSTLSDLN